MNKPRISLIIPTLNHPRYLDLCIRSAIKHSQPGNVEVLVFSNEHGEETARVLSEMKRDNIPARLAGHSEANEGICLPVKLCAERAAGAFIFYANDDFYFLPGWDKAILSRVRPGAYQYLTPNCIGPRGKKPDPDDPHDFGRTIDAFRETDLLKFWQGAEKPDVASCASPAFIAKWLWDAVDGFDVGYWPGFCHDPDFAMKLIQSAKACGQEASFLRVGNCGVYHFQAITTARLRSNGSIIAAKLRFKQKWGFKVEEFGEMVGEGTPV